MIRVEKDAQRTDAYQKDDNLILSEHARADSIPGLEIEANDVRCTHGATAGRVNEEMIFYAQARGVRRETAIRLIVEGFFANVYDRITLEPVRETLRQAVAAKLELLSPTDPDPDPRSPDPANATGARPMAEAYVHPEVLVSADWVEQHLDDPKVRIVESDEDVLLYDMGHIPGLGQDRLAGRPPGPADPRLHRRREVRRDLLPGRDRQRHHRRLLRRQVELVGLLRPLGVQALRPRGLPDPQRRPEALDRPEAADDDRGPRATRRPSTPSAGRDEAAIRAFRDEVLAHSKSGKPLLDVRSPKEFTGERTHMEEYPQEGSLRGGHIPGAVSVPWARAVNDDGTFKSAEELKAIYQGEVGLKPDRRHRRLLPDRRAVEPDLVRPDLPARLPQGPQLRRLVVRVGQPRPRPDRQGGLSRVRARARKFGEIRARPSTRTGSAL